MAKITRDDVLRLSKLSKISLSDDEIDALAKEFTDILQYVEQLQAVDTTGLEPTNQVSGNVNVMREDEVRGYGYAPEDLLKNVPSVENNLIKVKRMIG